MKRTTLVLEDNCMEGVRALAHREKRDISSVVNELIRDGLRNRRKRKPVVITLPTYSMGRPRVNLADRDALENVMES